MLIQQLIRDQLEDVDQAVLDQLYNKYVLENANENRMVFRSPNNTLKKQEIAYNMAKELEAEERTRMMLIDYYLALSIKEKGQKTESASSTSASFHYIPSPELPKMLKTADKSLIISQANQITEAIRQCDQKITEIFSKMQNSLNVHSQTQIADLELGRKITAQQAGPTVVPDAPFNTEPVLKPSQLVTKFDQDVYRSPVQDSQPKPEPFTALQQQKRSYEAALQTQQAEIAAWARQLVSLIRTRQSLVISYESLRMDNRSAINTEVPIPSDNISSLLNMMSQKRRQDPEEELADQFKNYFLNSIQFIDTSSFRR